MNILKDFLCYFVKVIKDERGFLGGITDAALSVHPFYKRRDDPTSIFAGQEAVRRPEDIKYSGITGKGGQLKSPYSAQSIQPGTFQSRLMQQAQGPIQPSQALSMGLQQQRLGESQALQQAAAGQAGAQAQQQAALAARGGLRGGAAERLAQSGQEQLQLGRQSIRGQGLQQRLGMQAQDLSRQEQYQRGLQGQLVGQERQAGLLDLQSRLQDQRAREQFKQQKYAQDMQAWAADQAARQQESLGMRKQATSGLLGQGGLLGSGISFGL